MRNEPNHTVFEENITYASKVPLKRNTDLCLACAGPHVLEQVTNWSSCGYSLLQYRLCAVTLSD
ncbi:hypothetical protein SORBI_3005G086801 [Sorghum bicolor]|uniref:Uncharacterized protein n=1 Tax=Sorghum bicolor TaxID=4558 RepID=A0A1Z5RHC7_SORBI|nr:hypothetical protein SORBI_3005G086801 [Sorghum bicolor]